MQVRARAERSHKLQAAWRQAKEFAPGLIAAIILAQLAAVLGKLFPLVGAPLIAIVAGMALRAVAGLSPRYRAGLQWTAKRVLQVSIALLGASLSFWQLREAGPQVLAVLVVVIATACATALGTGRLMGVGRRMNSLLAVGTAICGASAIATLSPVVEAEEAEISYSVTTVFVGSVLAMIAFPAVGYALGLSQEAFGWWAGAAINDTSSVVATGFSYGSEAGQLATAVKLARTLMLVPLVLLFSLSTRRQRRTAVSARSAIPWFVVGFLLLSGLRTYGVLPETWAGVLSGGARSLIVVALAAVGLTSDLASLRRVSWKPLFVGLISWLAVAAVSLAAIVLIHGL